ncbi:MAG: nuclear transport factor 2 family protein [Deltaproteobacteria bacterium]|nr:nuclear transport factor 2 family protein [Deltaproteobacteria bacterium]MBW2399686.1 nuclear transport factor 2 family protein [Deltaproteobacteria bacterium]
MADANHIRQVYERYPELVSKTDIDAIVDLYAEDGKIEDPIGSDLHVGRDAIRAFYETAIGAITMKQTGPVRIAGNEAATPVVVLLGSGEQRKALDIISAMVFDEAGKITSMRAWWSADAMRSARPEE